MPTATTSRARRAGTDVAEVTADHGARVARDSAEQAQGVVADVADRGSALAGQAKQDARDVVETARARAGDVTEELSVQGRSLVEETTEQLEQQAKAGAQRMARSFQRLGGEAQALAEGRPEEAPVLSDYVWKMADGCYGAADRLQELATDVETRGFPGVLDDLQGYARRRPGTFLLGAAVVGFGIGRFVKAESARRQAAESDRQRQAITTRAGA